jgi:hypothetical protein
MEIVAIALLLLFLGDFFSTFFYHISEHVFGKLHLSTHHAGQQSFRHYAVLSPSTSVLLDGLFGALPYILLAPLLGIISPLGVVLGLVLGQAHVWWRHTNALGWQTPEVVRDWCDRTGIVTPEQHWLHHQRTSIAYGDIFTCLDAPGRQWLRWLRWLRRSRELSAIKTTLGLGSRVDG